MKEYFLKTLGERLEWMIKELEYTPSEFSRKLGYKSPDTVYHIIGGKNGLSSSFCNRLNSLKKEISIDWLVNGEGSPFNYNIQDINRFYVFNEVFYPSKLSFHWLKEFALVLGNELFYVSNSSYSAHVTISGIGGLDFIFVEYGDCDTRKYAIRYYNILINPDWTVGRFFDYWNSIGADSNLKYDNMFYLLKDEDGDCKTYSPKREYSNIVYKFLESVKPYLKDIQEKDDLDLPFLDNSFNGSRKLTELFSTDSREIVDRKEIFKTED
ncbi:hypothetical protein [Myroides odoratus]|uniref:HTH cro/C1-type domain-containing protein n=1 Tax=Myroides odoratus TaxID=256 RepID=A0A378RIY6_MYROD|nr:hypothetical protein [Myroides odoratus]QQU02168.1 hypothetical protein I6I89_09810 [Myroides odoratus]STZ26925.1 Uncharacterised protein [Myroides odoratus]